MLKRLNIYFKEMYPLIPRLLLGGIVFFEIYFFVIFNQGVTIQRVGEIINYQEAIGAFTIFAFLMWLRMADDIKDYELDKRLFKERPLPSGRVTHKDLMICCTIVQSIALILNMAFMNNAARIAFVVLYVYGYLMSKWFFQRSKIQPNLPLALVTHNPVQMFINMYIISFTCYKYALSPFRLTTIMALFTLYFPALIWEISRKIRAPKDENEYVTYSKLFGYKKATRFVLILTIADIITNFILVYNLNKISLAVLFALVSWMTWQFVRFMKDPEKFKLVSKVELYTYLQEGTMLLTVAAYMVFGKI
ncbi:MAG: UbiA family prenyltransferase [Clostridia bacterium]|nr:UbiA family prenyltransferase [Clostridia bacterium]